MLLLCLSGSVVFWLPFFSEVYYVPMQDAFGFSNTQIGLLSSTFGFAAPEMFVAPPISIGKPLDVFAFGASAWFLASKSLPPALCEKPPYATHPAPDFAAICDPNGDEDVQTLDEMKVFPGLRWDIQLPVARCPVVSHKDHHSVTVDHIGKLDHEAVHTGHLIGKVSLSLNLGDSVEIEGRPPSRETDSPLTILVKKERGVRSNQMSEYKIGFLVLAQ